MTVRKFYQIYVDANSYVELFNIRFDDKFDAPHLYATILKVLCFHGMTKFDEDDKQYVVHLEDGTEVKFAKIRLLRKVWIHVSSKDPNTPEKILNNIICEIKRAYDSAHKEI